MKSLLLATAILTGSGGSVEEPICYESTRQAAEVLQDELQNGSLIFSQGDCLAVRVFTQSPYTHVAVAVHANAEGIVVYDSTNGIGVRRLALEDYLASQTPGIVEVHNPGAPLTESQVHELTAYLDSQLGRPYAIRHHLTGERCEGLHCAEYATDALMAINLIRANRPPKVSPSSLREGVTLHRVYTAACEFEIKPPEAVVPEGDNVCSRLWIDTKVCCRNCWRQMRAWVLCE